MSFDAERFEQSNKSLNLSGNNQYVTVAHNSLLDLDNLGISAWVNADYVSGLREIVSKFQDVNGNSPILLRVNNGKLNIDNTVESTNNLSSNKWHHLAMTRQGDAASAPFQLYIDGKQVASTGSTNNLSTLDSDNLTINSDYTLTAFINDTSDKEPDRFFDWKIDEVKIYNRVLTVQEVSAL